MDAKTIEATPPQTNILIPGLTPGEPPALEALRQRREQIIAIFKKHGASNVRIFGSVARNEATAESDIDFMCDYNINQVSAWFPSGLALELEEYLGVKVDIALGMNFRTERIKQKVEKDLVKL